MDAIKPVEPRQPKNPKTFISPDLISCTHVFVRVDTVRKALQPPYEGPFQVVRRTRKTIAITRKGQTENISIDRVKPAYIMDQYGPLSTSKKKKVSFIFPK
ncbi:Uncharacterized protein FKW44_015343 [Caligus rogercresseyi]|uniref:Uncharacterized protein n=1 Tax=Caligus rogercresseyi TaxID=217165 RepID=A0A7T8GYC5_CALRO|nr:Uncharacterized protein FKW44_013604 [Caligus rogercresseyi]QQP41086.1 Uncharacterized protein FKW44_015343 [Caligus rogercresseyi]